MAFDGRSFLVAWSDFRNGKDWDLYAARVSPGGKVLDPEGFPVAAVPGNQAYPAVASDGKGTSLVAWSDVRPQPARPQAEVYALFGTFVRNGRPLESSGHELGRAPSSILMPAAVWDGSAYLVIAGKGGGGWSFCEPFAVTVSPAGKAQPTRLWYQFTYSLAADPAGKRTLIWNNGRREHGAYCTLYSTSILTGGKATGGMRVLGLQWAFAPANEQWCAATFDGKDFVAVVEQAPTWPNEWKPKSLPLNVELAATRVDPATGKPLDAGYWDKKGKPPNKEFHNLNNAKKAIVVASEPGTQSRHPAMASCGGGRSLLVYSRHGGVEDFKIHGILLRNGVAPPAPTSSSRTRPEPAPSRSAEAGAGATPTAPAAPKASAVPAASVPPPATRSPEQVCRGWWSLAMSYKRAGRADKAREYLQKIVKEHPKNEYAARARKEIAKL